MFDQLKVNQNSIINLLKVPDKENSDILSIKPVNDFLSMVMEKTDYDERGIADYNRSGQIQEQQRPYEQAKPEHNNVTQENTRTSGQSDNKRDLPDQEMQNSKNTKSNQRRT